MKSDNINTLKEINYFLIEELEHEHYGMQEWAFDSIEEQWGLTKEDLKGI